MTVIDSLGLVGTTIDDKYEVEAVVGEGGFAIVYRANHKLWQKPVALKCFRALMDSNPAMREGLLKAFIQEGALLSELSSRSASIVQARDVGTFTTPAGAWIPYMVLEWLEGENLDDLWGRNRSAWPIEHVVAVLEPIAVGLDLAHRRNIAHRDIKPANVFIIGKVGTDSLVVKLLDFGIAKVVESAADHGFTKTGANVTSFTPSYGAPEQFSRSQGATGPWTDVYALALIFSELVSGQYALEGDDFIQLGMMSADPNRRPTPATLGVDVGAPLEAVLKKALAVKPTERYQNAGEFWNAVSLAVGNAPVSRLTLTSKPMMGGGGSAADASGGTRREAFAATMAEPDGSNALGRGPTTSPQIGSGAVQPKKRSPLLAVAIVVGIAAVAAGSFFAFRSSGDESGKKTAASGKSSNDTPTKVAPSTSVTGATSISASASTAATLVCPAGMALIPAGKTFIGSDAKDADDDEKPLHQVTLSPYCMDIHEVTVAEYKACSDKGECKRGAEEVDFPEITPAQKKTLANACTVRDPVGFAKHPINCVDWEMAKTYCDSNGKRLPTEAEWEFAARGSDGRIYPWGDEPPDSTRVNACGTECAAWQKKNGIPIDVPMYKGDDGYALTAPVGTFPKGASKYGLLDIVGNVWEWTSDWDDWYNKAGKPEVDPKGPETGTERIIRGGAFNGAKAAWLRPSQRYRFVPSAKSHVIGFRCAKGQK